MSDSEPSRAARDDDAAPADDAYRRGMTTRRRVLGDAHVDRAGESATAFDADFQRFITEGAWGSVWARPGISARERSMVTMALLAAAGHEEELAMHARACTNTGASADDLKEVMLHVAVYAGVPAANRAIKVLKRALPDADGAPGDGPAPREEGERE